MFRSTASTRVRASSAAFTFQYQQTLSRLMRSTTIPPTSSTTPHHLLQQFHGPTVRRRRDV